MSGSKEEQLGSSFWLLPRVGKKKIYYRGGLHPQVVRQLILKYTRKGDLVLDPFMGGGTVIFESLAEGRLAVGIDINENIVKRVDKEVKRKFYGEEIKYKVFCGDSALAKTHIIVEDFLKEQKKEVDFIVLHPPYFQAIKYSNNSSDLSNAPSINVFNNKLEKVIKNAGRLLKRDGYIALVISDVWGEGKIEMLGFKSAEKVLKCGYILRSIVVKNVRELGVETVWEKRAKGADYYNFNHEYIFIFKKIKSKN